MVKVSIERLWQRLAKAKEILVDVQQDIESDYKNHPYFDDIINRLDGAIADVNDVSTSLQP